MKEELDYSDEVFAVDTVAVERRRCCSPFRPTGKDWEERTKEAVGHSADYPNTTKYTALQKQLCCLSPYIRLVFPSNALLNRRPAGHIHESIRNLHISVHNTHPLRKHEETQRTQSEEGRESGPDKQV